MVENLDSPKKISHNSTRRDDGFQVSDFMIQILSGPNGDPKTLGYERWPKVQNWWEGGKLAQGVFKCLCAQQTIWEKNKHTTQFRVGDFRRMLFEQRQSARFIVICHHGSHLSKQDPIRLLQARTSATMTVDVSFVIWTTTSKYRFVLLVAGCPSRVFARHAFLWPVFIACKGHPAQLWHQKLFCMG